MKTNIKIILAIGGVAVVFCASWILYLRWAHSSFDNYYKSRGCTQLIAKTDNNGICKLKDGKMIEIVKYQGKWYLAGDLPNGKFLDL